MITWDLFESQFDLDEYLKEIGATLHSPEKEITFPCWGFTFVYYDQSHGVEIVTKTDLERFEHAMKVARMEQAGKIIHDILSNYECGDEVDRKLAKALDLLGGRVAV